MEEEICMCEECMKAGLPQKEWNRVLDNYLWGTGTMLADEFGMMNPVQNHVINEIKKSKKRK